MTFISIPVTRARITDALARNPATHLRPLMQAVRDHGCHLCIVTQNAGRFDPPTRRPMILVIGDDLESAMGPNAFHRKSLRRYIRRCRAGVIVSCGPLKAAYVAAAIEAVLLRRDVLIVETRLEYEESWRRLLIEVSPAMSMLIATERAQGGVQ